ncbi:MAG: FAD binding domain-containing protein [Planctomycetota bacterium]|jgi:xanthine dehydrogenase YagS FAD-binding subunit
MNRFAIARPRTLARAGDLLADDRFALPVLKAGGMDVVDHLKEGLSEPDLLVDLMRVEELAADEPVVRDEATGRLRASATTTLAGLAGSALARERAPAVAHAVASAATPQVRNVATVAGNLLQRPRCWYYRHEQFHCLKKGGPTCYAVEGENKFHAVFGGGPCHIVHPSNLAVALMVCDGHVHLAGGDRDTVPIADLYHLPEGGVRGEHELEPGEIVTHITFAPAPASGFCAVKEKQSFDWPLVMAAAAVTLDGVRIAEARVCAGAVAPVPWPLPRVAEALRGVDIDDDEALRGACADAAAGATPMRDNASKLRLLPVAVRRAVMRAAGRTPDGLS